MDETPISDKGRLLFGAGFAFGGTCILILLAIVVATVGGPSLSIGTLVFLPIAGSVVFSAIIGAALYLLAFPENRALLPISDPREPVEEDESV
jgi:ABC-type Fe3+-siderophore transport system permease subunit